jgi:catechol 2,3-dioxygenase-like lactoylglutathione lyase family enzyme
MLDKARGVATRLPAQDLDRARRFYAEKLGLEPSEGRPGGLQWRVHTLRLGWDFTRHLHADGGGGR